MPKRKGSSGAKKTMAKKKSTAQAPKKSKIIPPVNLFETKRKLRRNLWVIFWLAILGLIISSYLFYLHCVPLASSPCDINEYISCDIVNKSIYSKIWFIPWASLGMLAYLFFIISSFGLNRHFDFTRIAWVLENERMYSIMFWMSVIGFGVQTYLAYIEFFVLQTICPFCVTSHLIITLILIYSILNVSYIFHYRKFYPKDKKKNVCEFC